MIDLEQDGKVMKTRRQLYDHTQKWRGRRIALISSLVVLALFYFLVPLSPGWDAVKTSFFNWEMLKNTFPKLLSAFMVDIMLFAWCAPAILIFALFVALARSTTSPLLLPLRVMAIFFIDLFRAVPVILTIYIVGFGIPGLGLIPPWNSPYIWGSVALILTYSAYLAEVYRAGIDSIHKSQTSAAASLGFSKRDIMRFIILPQAVSRVLPALMNFMISLQKDVALLSFIGPIEVLRQANVFKSLYGNFTPYVGAAILFLIITIPATRIADHLIARQNRKVS